MLTKLVMLDRPTSKAAKPEGICTYVTFK